MIARKAFGPAYFFIGLILFSSVWNPSLQAQSPDASFRTPAPHAANESPGQHWLAIGSAYSLQKALQSEGIYESQNSSIAIQWQYLKPLIPAKNISWYPKIEYQSSRGQNQSEVFSQELWRLGAGVDFPLSLARHFPYINPQLSYGASRFRASQDAFFEQGLFFSVSLGYQLPLFYGLRLRLEKQITQGLNQALNGSRFEQNLIKIEL